MNPEKHKKTISKEISKRIKAGIVIPTSVLVAQTKTQEQEKVKEFEGIKLSLQT